ncbi:MAG: hypothetical protein LBG73_03760 [Spirochaetaceae bacterium]|jgi:hypothetical protein|nr:hypothetical protein [Spirochaetaceae bacterium]
MTKLKSRFGAILAIAALWGAGLAGFTGCSLDQSPAEAVSEGYGRVTIDLGDAMESVNRTVYPDKPDASRFVYTYVFTRIDGLDFQGTEETVARDTGRDVVLKHGKWTVTVNAYIKPEGVTDNDAKTADNLTATGTAQFVLNAITTQNNTISVDVPVTLEGRVESGAGTFSYTITYPAGTSITTLTMKKLPDLSEEIVLNKIPNTPSTPSISYVVKNVPAGFYLVTVLADKIGGSSGKNEVVHIYKNLTTEYAPTFDDNDFTNIPLNFNGWTDGNIVSIDEPQWFSFTSTSLNTYDYVYFDLGTLQAATIEVYNASTPGMLVVATKKSSDLLDDSLPVQSSWGSETPFYVKVSSSANSTGTYQIGVNSSNTSPAVNISTIAPQSRLLTHESRNGIPEVGIINAVGDTQWFKITGENVYNEYIHAYVNSRGGSISVQVYNRQGVRLGDPVVFPNSTPCFSRPFTYGQDYYIKVKALTNSVAYTIAYNAVYSGQEHIILPTSGITPLSDSIWTRKSIEHNGEQWFSFYRNVTYLWQSSYIFFDPGNTYLDIEVYDGNGDKVITTTEDYKQSFSNNNSNAFYYIRVRNISDSDSALIYNIAYSDNNSFRPSN